MKKFLLSALVTVVLAVLALLWSFYPQRLTPAKLPLDTLPSAHPPSEMSLSALSTGDMHTKAALAYRGGAFSEERVFSQTAVLIRHPKGDLLIDTGLGRMAVQHFAGTPWLLRKLTQIGFGHSAADQLAAASYDIHKLAGIIPTHAHWDHVSGLPDFPGVPVWLNTAEEDFIQNGGSLTELARSFGKLPVRTYEFSTKSYLGFEHSLDVWGDGSVVLVPAPGHTPGSIIVFVALPSGQRYALVGDLVWQLDGIERPAERPFATRFLADSDEAAVRAAISHVATLHRRFPQIKWLPAHDARAMGALPVFPAQAQ